MYYLLAAIFFIIVYFALTKLLSSILKGCLVTVGIFILIFSVFILLKSANEPVLLFNQIVIDNFSVRIKDVTDEVLGGWEINQ